MVGATFIALVCDREGLSVFEFQGDGVSRLDGPFAHLLWVQVNKMLSPIVEDQDVSKFPFISLLRRVQFAELGLLGGVGGRVHRLGHCPKEGGYLRRGRAINRVLARLWSSQNSVGLLFSLGNGGGF